MGILERIESKLDKLLIETGLTLAGEAVLMALADDEIARIAKQGTTIDSIKALLDAWVATGQISPSQAAAINAAFDANDAKLSALEAALQPTTPPPLPLTQ